MSRKCPGFCVLKERSADYWDLQEPRSVWGWSTRWCWQPLTPEFTHKVQVQRGRWTWRWWGRTQTKDKLWQTFFILFRSLQTHAIIFRIARRHCVDTLFLASPRCRCYIIMQINLCLCALDTPLLSIWVQWRGELNRYAATYMTVGQSSATAAPVRFSRWQQFQWPAQWSLSGPVELPFLPRAVHFGPLEFMRAASPWQALDWD